MADYRPIVLVSGVRQLLQATDRLQADGIVANTATDLELVADGGQLVTIPANVDLEFGAADGQIGSSGDMIEVQNLLDKSANETISGTYTFSNATSISFSAGTNTIAGIQNQNLLDKTDDETVTLGVGDSWTFISSGDNTAPNLVVQATAAQEASTDRILFQVQDSGGANLFSVDSEGDVNIAGAETVSSTSTVVGTANFQGDVNLGNGGDTINVGSGPTDTVNFNGPIVVTIDDTDNYIGIRIDNNDVTNSPNSFQVEGVGGELTFVVNEGTSGSPTVETNTVGEIELNTSNAASGVDINATAGPVTVDSALSSNFTIGANAAGDQTLTLAATNAGAGDGLVAISADGAVSVDSTAAGFSIDGITDSNVTVTGNAAGDQTLTISASNAGAGDGLIDMDADGAITIDSSGAGVSIDGNAASNFTVDSADLVLSTTTSGELDLTSAGLMDVNAAANLDIDVTGTFDMLSSSTFSIDGTGASNVSADTGALTISTTTSGDLNLTAADEVHISDGYNAGSSWAQTYMAFADNAAEWTTFETNFGEVSLLNALNQAASAASAASSLILTGMTTAGLAAGDIAYVSGNDTFGQADADNTAASARAIGIYAGIAGEIVVGGEAAVTIADAGAPTVGDPIYLSATAGQGTATAPSGPGDYVTFIGYCLDPSTHAGAGTPVQVLLSFARPILI
jgi:hypothetical protein